MKITHHLLTAFAASCLAAGSALADDPTGMWKGFATYQGDVLLIHPVFSIELKDGKLTGRQIMVNALGVVEYRPLMDPTFKDGVLSFDVMIPPAYDNGVTVPSMGPGTTAPKISTSPGGGSGFGGGRRRGGSSPNSDPFHASDDTAGPSGGLVAYQGTLAGNTIIGQYTKDDNAPSGRPPGTVATGFQNIPILDVDTTQVKPDGAAQAKGELTGKWLAARITPAGIWDVSMHVLPGDGESRDHDSPLHAVSAELMKFDSKNLVLTGVWRRSPIGGHRQAALIKNVAFTADGLTFSADVENSAGKTVYEFAGEYVGTIDDDIVRGPAPKVSLWPNGGAEVDDFGRTIDVMEGTVKITGPDGKVYNSKWHAVRDSGRRASVEMGTPVEVKPSGKP